MVDDDNLTLELVEAVTCRAERFGAATAFSAVTVLAREVTPGALFVALRLGDHDGGRDIPEAIARGAAGVVCAPGCEVAAGAALAVFRTSSPWASLWELAVLWRTRFDIPFVAVAGSVGKTTIKDFIGVFLRARGWQVHTTRDSRNGHVGLPLTLLGLRHYHQAAVVEIGIEAPAAMSEFLTMVRPTVAVIATIAEEHLRGLSDLETVAREECLALEGALSRSGIAVVNSDDLWLRRWLDAAPGAGVVRFALDDAGADLRGSLAADESHLIATGLGLEQESLPLRVAGRHNVTNLLAAVAVARSMGGSVCELQAGADAVMLPPGRCEIQEMWPGFVAIGDHYNASPRSMRAAIELLGQHGGRRWACLGDMLDLGDSEERLHRRLAEPLMDAKIDRVELVGERMGWLREELHRKRFNGALRYHPDQRSLALALAREIRRGDSVLLKASNAMDFDRIWQFLGAAASARRIGVV